MTVTIPLQQQLDYTELKYCLRAIDKFLPGIPVVIIGAQVPEWITGVTQIKIKDIVGRKQLTIKTKIHAALQYDPEIICIHDDIYLLRPFEFKYYYWGDLTLNKSESGARILRNELQAQGKPISHYDVHNPFIYELSKFEALTTFSSDTVVKSAYGNYWQIPAELMPDVKIDRKTDARDIKAIIKNRPYFSSGSLGVRSCLPVLEELFPQKSCFEI